MLQSAEPYFQKRNSHSAVCRTLLSKVEMVSCSVQDGISVLEYQWCSARTEADILFAGKTGGAYHPILNIPYSSSHPAPTITFAAQIFLIRNESG